MLSGVCLGIQNLVSLLGLTRVILKPQTSLHSRFQVAADAMARWMFALSFQMFTTKCFSKCSPNVRVVLAGMFRQMLAQPRRGVSSLVPPQRGGQLMKSVCTRHRLPVAPHGTITRIHEQTN